MKKLIFAFSVLWSGLVFAAPTDLFLFYNSASENLSEIGINQDELFEVFDDLFGPASDELPQEVKYSDFYVSKFPDGRYVFILDAPFNCGQLGCNSKSYTRDTDDKLVASDSIFPVKCVTHGDDKLVCAKGGYKVEKPKNNNPKKRGPVHYPAPAFD